MTTDPYMDAINAGAAALAKPYRDPDTISAFVETFPTIAAARVIDAALPHLRATILAEAIPPGPCRATEQVPAPTSNGPQNLVALCDLRAGHAGQHEADDINHGHFRWTAESEASRGCESVLRDEGHQRCVRVSGHVGYHVGELLVWNDYETVIARGALIQGTEPPKQCDSRARLTPTDLRVCERTSGHSGYHIDGHAVWDDRGDWISRD